MTTPHELTPAELAAAALLLDQAAELYSNHGCNDLELPNTDANWALANAVAEENRMDLLRRPPLDRPILTQDWMVMQYLSKRFKEAAKVAP